MRKNILIAAAIMSGMIVSAESYAKVGNVKSSERQNLALMNGKRGFKSKSKSTPTPLVLGYFTNWGVYDANYQPSNIPTNIVDEIEYSFVQIGDCMRNPGSSYNPLYPLGYATETHPDFCLSGPTKGFSGTQDYKIHTTDPWSDFKRQSDGNDQGLETINKVLSLGKPVLLSIGGWSLSPLIRWGIQPEKRTEFINSIIDFLDSTKPIRYLVGAPQSKEWGTNKFSGVDIDWEPNGNNWTLQPSDPNLYVTVSKEDLNNFRDFLRELRIALDQAYANGILKNNILRMVTSASPSVVTSVDAKYGVDPTYGRGYWEAISHSVNSIDIMTYDYHGSWNAGGCIGFNSPIKNDPTIPATCDFNPKWNMEDSIQAYIDAGVPKEKLMAGAPTYGRTSYVLTANMPTPKPYQIFNNPYKNPDGEDLLTNRIIYTGKIGENPSGFGNFVTNFTRYPRNVSEPIIQNYAWAKNPNAEPVPQQSDNIFITLDDAESAKARMQYIKQHNLAGIIVWSLDGDVRQGDTFLGDATYELSSVLYGLNQGKLPVCTPPSR